jgi:hypothetical protein
MPIDLLEFFCLTPLPGSEDHQVLWKNKCPATLSCSSSNGQCRRVRRRIYRDLSPSRRYHEAWLLY